MNLIKSPRVEGDEDEDEDVGRRGETKEGVMGWIWIETLHLRLLLLLLYQNIMQERERERGSFLAIHGFIYDLKRERRRKLSL